MFNALFESSEITVGGGWGGGKEARTYLSCLVYHFESNQNMINIILKLEHFEFFLPFKWGLKWR